MVRSMTCFGAAEGPLGAVRVSVELRSVNHRFFNPTIKLPASFARWGGEVREALRQRVSRGHVTLTARGGRRRRDGAADARRARRGRRRGGGGGKRGGVGGRGERGRDRACGNAARGGRAAGGVPRGAARRRRARARADRLDVSEELGRFRSHLAAFRAALRDGGPEPVGKRLGFVLQEMLREANTTGS